MIDLRSEEYRELARTFDGWMCGLTCVHYQKIKSVFYVSEDGKWAIFKHKGHGTKRGDYCETHYDLMLVGTWNAYGDKSLKIWHGRWKTEYMQEAIDIIEKLEVK